MVIDTVQACLHWKCREKPVVEYNPSDIYALYLDFKKAGYKNLRRFFFHFYNARREPSVKQALECLKDFRPYLRGKACDELQKLEKSGRQHSLKKNAYIFFIPLYHFMYETPLEEVPLYLNTEAWALRPTVKWRLKIGR